jgi:single-stranded DNA-binding protein
MSSFIQTGFASFEILGTIDKRGLEVADKVVRFTLMRRVGDGVAYFKIVAFRDDRTTQLAVEMLKPGNHVHVRGDIRPTSWVDQTTKQTRTGVDYVMQFFVRCEPDQEEAERQSARYLEHVASTERAPQQALPPALAGLTTEQLQALLALAQAQAAPQAVPAPTPRPTTPPPAMPQQAEPAPEAASFEGAVFGRRVG